MSLRRGRGTQWCKEESERELVATTTFTVPVGDPPKLASSMANETEWHHGEDVL
jgi:hypothetical protein